MKTLSNHEYLQINQVLFSLVNAYHRRANQDQGSAFELGVSERGVLIVIGQFSPINQRRLAELMQLSPGPISQYVQKLVIKNLVKKEQDLKDRRNWWLKLTPDGHNVYLDTIQGAVEYTKDFLNSLEDTEQHDFYLLLLKIAHDLNYPW